MKLVFFSTDIFLGSFQVSCKAFEQGFLTSVLVGHLGLDNCCVVEACPVHRI